MQINNDMRLERFEKGTVIQQNLYASPEAGRALYELSTRFGIPEESYLDFVTVFGDIVLGFYAPTALEKNLRENPKLSSLVSLPLVSELQTLLKPLIDTDVAITSVGSEEPTTVATEIAETEAELDKLSKLRTMATDGAQVGYQSTDEPVYTSVQSALLNESK
jgi:hypothetical protein